MRALTAYRNSVLKKCRGAKLYFNTPKLPPPHRNILIFNYYYPILTPDYLLLPEKQVPKMTGVFYFRSAKIVFLCPNPDFQD